MEQEVKDIILNYIIKEFGTGKKSTRHYSYCSFPEGECVCKELNNISYDTPLISGGFIDSFSMTVVLVFLEDAFNIKIPDKEALPKNFDSVDKMSELVKICKKRIYD